MQLGMIGLGRMGANMIRRVMRAKHSGVVFDRSPDSVASLVKEGAAGAASLEEFAAWVMVPAGAPTVSTVGDLLRLMEPGDTVIDGGNSYFKDDVRRAAQAREKKIHYLDVGTSGGVWGLERGYCLMIGGTKEAVDRLDPIFRALAPGRGTIPRTPGREKMGGTAEEGYLYCGPSGAGHFVKMVHNGIEYGLMQAYAEGFDISVVGSWLLDLTAMALAENPQLSEYTGRVQDSGEGRWTIFAAIEEAVPAAVLSAALYTRFRSRQDQSFAEKVLSAMRQKFGGHVELPTGG